MDFLTLSKNLKRDYSSFQPYRVAFISDVATQLVVKALRGYAFDLKINLEIYDIGLGQSEQELLNQNSEFYHFKPQSLFFYHSFAALQSTFFKMGPSEKMDLAKSFLAKTEQKISLLTAKNYQQIFLGTFPQMPDPVSGFSGTEDAGSLSHQVKKINDGLISICRENEVCRLYPVDSFIATAGYDNFYDPQLFYSSFSDISFKILPDFARFTLQNIASFTGAAKKCIILDLDNTLWGGIVGDDGWENLEIGNLGRGKVFTDIQYWLKELKNKGILLIVCSKNDEATAKDVFRKHPDMVLKLEDFAVFKANWDIKSENIRQIITTLNIGVDSIIFLDDNPAEREQVKQIFPELTIPDLPADPSSWLAQLIRNNYFHLGKQTREDLERTIKYQNQDAREQLSSSVQDHETYLKSLQMEAKVELINSYNLPRIAQLTQKTNQFNLRTIRYSESEIQDRINGGNYIGFAISLKDKFGDEGIVSFVFLEKRPDELFIDTWVMSCRVFGRGLEHFIFDLILEQAQNSGSFIRAEYIPTIKNKHIEKLLPDLGFSTEGQHYVLDLEDAIQKECYIFPLNQ